MLAGTFLLPVPKPPCFAHASAAGAVARYFTNASIAGVSRNVTNRSPPISTAPASAPGVIEGHVNVLKPVFGFAFVEDVITPPTKSASNTIAAFGGDEHAFAPDLLAALKTSAYSLPLYVPSCFHAGAKFWLIVAFAYWIDLSLPCLANCATVPGCAMSAMSGGLPPATAVASTVGRLSPTGWYL